MTTRAAPGAPASACGRACKGNMPTRVKKPRQKAANAAPNISSASPLGSMPAMSAVTPRQRCRRSHRVATFQASTFQVLASAPLAHFWVCEARLVAVEEMAEQAAVEIGCPEQPVHDRERQIHVPLHH